MHRAATIAAVIASLALAPSPTAAQPASPAATAAQPATAPATPAADTTLPKVTVLVAYASLTGATEDMARAVEAGARSVPGTHVLRKTVATVTAEDLATASAIVVGTPVHNAGMLGEVAQFIDRWPFEQMNNRVGAAFVAAGGTSAGEELATLSILGAMLVHRMVIVGGETWQAALGASAITEEGQPADRQGKVPERDREEARALGRRVATLAHALARGNWLDRRP